MLTEDEDSRKPRAAGRSHGDNWSLSLPRGFR